MSMNIVPFSFDNLPAAVAKRRSKVSNELVGNSPSGGFPVISIKGKVFHIQRGDERTLITKPGEDDPAGSIEVVLVKANPNRSKVFYAAGYQEGEKNKPDCYSNDGIAPAADAQEPQSKKCATCVHNQWGSKVSADGRKGRACADTRRIAVATVDTPADPLLVRVPGGSLKALEEYGKQLLARGIEPYAVVTKIGFDYSVAHPALTFRAVGYINDDRALEEIEEVRKSDIVAQIIGMAPSQGGEEDEPAPAPAALPPAPAPAEEKPKAAAKAPKPTVDAAVDAAVAAAPKAPKASVKVEKAAPAVAPATGGSLEDELKGMIDGLDFDD